MRKGSVFYDISQRGISPSEDNILPMLNEEGEFQTIASELLSEEVGGLTQRVSMTLESNGSLAAVRYLMSKIPTDDLSIKIEREFMQRSLTEIEQRVGLDYFAHDYLICAEIVDFYLDIISDSQYGYSGTIYDLKEMILANARAERDVQTASLIYLNSTGFRIISGPFDLFFGDIKKAREKLMKISYLYLFDNLPRIYHKKIDALVAEEYESMAALQKQIGDLVKDTEALIANWYNECKNRVKPVIPGYIRCAFPIKYGLNQSAVNTLTDIAGKYPYNVLLRYKDKFADAKQFKQVQRLGIDKPALLNTYFEDTQSVAGLFNAYLLWAVNKALITHS